MEARHIDRNRNRGKPGPDAGVQKFKDHLVYIKVKAGDVAVPFKERDELVGHALAKLRRLPADKRLRADYFSVGQIDLGLVYDVKFLVRKGDWNVALNFFVLDDSRFHVLVIDGIILQQVVLNDVLGVACLSNQVLDAVLFIILSGKNNSGLCRNSFAGAARKIISVVEEGIEFAQRRVLALSVLERIHQVQVVDGSARGDSVLLHRDLPQTL